MPVWPTPQDAISQRCRQAHRDHHGSEPTQLATAPATLSLIGEHADSYGAVVVMGLAPLSVAVAASSRTDGRIDVQLHQLGSDGQVTISSDSAVLSELHAHHLGDGAPAKLQLASQLGGVVATLIQRQLLSRDTAGFTLTVFSDIPPHAGLGELAAMEVATALAVVPDSGEELDAPARARFAEICAQASELYSPLPSLRARHTTALRAHPGQLAVIDYADHSVTHAPWPTDIVPVAVTVPGPAPQDAADLIGQRDAFLASAQRIFGVECLRLLPDAPARTIDWLSAAHEVSGPHGLPTIAEATKWMAFYRNETAAAHEVVRVLRSHRHQELAALLNRSQHDLGALLGLDNYAAVVRLARSRGATVARAASAATARSVIAWLRPEDYSAVVPALSADGFIITPLQSPQPPVAVASRVA